MMAEQFKPEELFERPAGERVLERLHDEVFRFVRTEKDPKTNRETEKEYLGVGGVELAINKEGEGTQFRREEFQDFCFDKKSLELLQTMARQLKLDHPLYLEGETDIGKTKTLELLACLTNNKLYTISCKGTTDPSEFFGKHVPESETLQRKILNKISQKRELSKETRKIISGALKEQRVFNLDDLKEISKIDSDRMEGVTAETRKILAKAALEGRGLTKEDWINIAELEGIDIEQTSFKWQDGEIVKQFQHNGGRGGWTYVDEMGAAEPQILVALNRLLERVKRIYLTEDAGRTVEGGPETRLIATSNPPNYAGRTPLAPDFLRRWKYEKSGPLDGETLEQRTGFIFKKTELPSEVSPFLQRALLEFHTHFQQQLKSLIKGQAQQFRVEFSDIIRVRDDLETFWDLKDPVASFTETISEYYIKKIEDGEAREMAKGILQEIMEGVIGPRISGKTLKQNIEEGAKKVLEAGISPEEKERIFQEKVSEVKRSEKELLEEMRGRFDIS